MSKRHETNRRRTYGRRQHELNQRPERPVRFLGWVEVDLTGRTAEPGAATTRVRSSAGDWILARGID
jgi:hypothetical protein